MTDVKALEIYYWTATLGSFSRAADCAKVSQPAVSQRIASLEREFGLPLLERGTRTVSLTPKGRDLLIFAERFMRLHAEMMSAMIENGNTTGVLRLGVSEAIAYTWLTALIEKIAVIFPKISVDTRIDLTSNMREALIRRELDIALMVGPMAVPTAIDVALCSFPYYGLLRRDCQLAVIELIYMKL